MTSLMNARCVDGPTGTDGPGPALPRSAPPGPSSTPEVTVASPDHTSEQCAKSRTSTENVDRALKEQENQETRPNGE